MIQSYEILPTVKLISPSNNRLELTAALRESVRPRSSACSLGRRSPRKIVDAKKSVFQFKVSLREIEPTIWRRIEVPARYSFWDLHVAIQDAMGWLDCHLHVFRVRNTKTGVVDEIGIPDEDAFEGDPVSLPGWEIPLAEYFMNPGDSADYEYDFGDGWEHEIVLEKIQFRVPGTKYPRCLDGARACPPEDCGGIGGYESLLEIIFDPSHEEHESMMTWLGGGFDPEAFNPKNVKFDSPSKRWKTAFGEG